MNVDLHQYSFPTSLVFKAKLMSDMREEYFLETIAGTDFERKNVDRMIFSTSFIYPIKIESPGHELTPTGVRLYQSTSVPLIYLRDERVSDHSSVPSNRTNHSTGRTILSIKKLLSHGNICSGKVLVVLRRLSLGIPGAKNSGINVLSRHTPVRWRMEWRRREWWYSSARRRDGWSPWYSYQRSSATNARDNQTILPSAREIGFPSASLIECFQVNYQDNYLQLQFFARFAGAHLEAMLYVVDDHIQSNARMFHRETFGDPRSFRFRKWSLISSRCSPSLSVQVKRQRTLPNQFFSLFVVRTSIKQSDHWIRARRYRASFNPLLMISTHCRSIICIPFVISLLIYSLVVSIRRRRMKTTIDEGTFSF